MEMARLAEQDIVEGPRRKKSKRGGGIGPNAPAQVLAEEAGEEDDEMDVDSVRSGRDNRLPLNPGPARTVRGIDEDTETGSIAARRRLQPKTRAGFELDEQESDTDDVNMDNQSTIVGNLGLMNIRELGFRNAIANSIATGQVGVVQPPPAINTLNQAGQGQGLGNSTGSGPSNQGGPVGAPGNTATPQQLQAPVPFQSPAAANGQPVFNDFGIQPPAGLGVPIFPANTSTPQGPNTQAPQLPPPQQPAPPLHLPAPANNANGQPPIADVEPVLGSDGFVLKYSQVPNQYKPWFMTGLVNGRGPFEKAGHKAGLKAGKKIGYEDGWKDGKEVGYDRGRMEGYRGAKEKYYINDPQLDSDFEYEGSDGFDTEEEGEGGGDEEDEEEQANH